MRAAGLPCERFHLLVCAASTLPPSCRPSPSPAVRLPDGRRVQRRFPGAAPVAAVYDLCLAHSEEAAGGRAFTLAQAGPGALATAGVAGVLLEAPLLLPRLLPSVLLSLCWRRCGGATVMPPADVATAAAHAPPHPPRSRTCILACPPQLKPSCCVPAPLLSTPHTAFCAPAYPLAGAAPLADREQAVEAAGLHGAMLVFKWD